VAAPQKITLIRAAPPLKCPSCSQAISWRHATLGGQFLCPACGRGLRVPGSYFRVLTVVSFVLVTLVAYAAGMRGDALFEAAMLGVFPVVVLLTFITIRLFPPDVETTGEFRGILYGSTVESEAIATSHPTSADTSPRVATPSPLADARPLFNVGKEPRTLEGAVLKLAVVVLVLGNVWIWVRPVVHRAFPEIGATETGPPVFPVQVHIGRDTVGFTNPSSAAWTCKASLGFYETYTATFSVGPDQTRAVPDLEFGGTDVAEDIEAQLDARREAAREKISIECAEPSGQTHYLEFR